MRTSLATAALLLAAGAAATAPKPTPRPTPAYVADDEVLILQDDFTTFNLSLWKHEITLWGDGNWCFQGYVNNRTNSYVRNGSLTISPTLTQDTFGPAFANNAEWNVWGGQPSDACTNNEDYGCDRTAGGANILNPIQSAAIRTAETFAFTYGRVEVVAKLPRGDWLWPAIWMMPVSSGYGMWPASGEIDIMESRGNNASYAPGGNNQFGSTLHWGPYWAEDAYAQTHAGYTAPTGDLTTDFHTYGLVWSPEGIYTYIDDPTNVVLNVSLGGASFWQRGGWENSTYSNPWQDGSVNAPFDQRMYLIINLAVGGTNSYFPDGVGGKPWSDASDDASTQFWQGAGQWLPTWTQPFQIDSVSVWQAPGGDNAFRLML